MLLAMFGWLLLAVAHDQFWLLAGAFSGFLIVAPILTTGLYQVSRNCATGNCVGMQEVISLWRSGDGRLVRFGLLLSVAGTGWGVSTGSLLHGFIIHPIPSPSAFLSHLVFSLSSWLFEMWVFLGGLLAAPVFASSVIAIPMLVDKPVTVMQAVHASWRAVASNPVALGLWALIIMMLVGVGMLTGLLGLIVIIPPVAHASWHVFRELTGVS